MKKLFATLLIMLNLFLVACAEAPTPTPPTPLVPVPTYYNVSFIYTEGGQVSGAGSYEAGKRVTVQAQPNSHYKFTGWYNNATLVSTDSTYSFTITRNTTLKAEFKIQYTNSPAYNENFTETKGSFDKTFNDYTYFDFLGEFPLNFVYVTEESWVVSKVKNGIIFQFTSAPVEAGAIINISSSILTEESMTESFSRVIGISLGDKVKLSASSTSTASQTIKTANTIGFSRPYDLTYHNPQYLYSVVFKCDYVIKKETITKNPLSLAIVFRKVETTYTLIPDYTTAKILLVAYPK